MASGIEWKLQQGEDSFTEFKGVAQSGYDLSPQDIAKEVVALANTKGGSVLIGVEDDGTASGVGDLQSADRIMQKVANVCQHTIQPPIFCTMGKEMVAGARILIVMVPGLSPGRPYSTNGRYYVRDGCVSRPASREELVRLLESSNVHFDEQQVHGATLEDLDEAAVERFLADHYDERTSAGPLEGREVALRYLRALGCLEDAVPTVSGILCFGLEPERWFTDARVSAVRIAGTEVSGDFAAHREIGGRLQLQIDEALAFVTTHLAAPSRVVGAVRLETGIPEKVVREAISNALSHRDYRAAAQTRVLVFDDRVEIGNPGGLLNRLTVDGILAGVTQRRNPRIAAVLARSGRGESLGLGVRLMVKEMKDRGLPPPELSETSGHFRVVLRAREAS